jgi:SulP family sulfate permease
MARTRYTDTAAPPLASLPASAARAVFAEGYGLEQLRADVFAGLVVGVVALPLSMALAIAVGVPPQHGLYTAIVAGLVVPLLGGSRFQITGPTAAFIVILAPIYVRFGLAGLLIAGAMAGLILIAMGAARLGGLIQFIPHPVTTGFTAGIGTVIAVLQLKDLLGLQLEHTPDHFLPRLEAMWQARHTIHVPEVAIGAFTFALLVIWPRITKRVPAPLVALTLAALAAVLLHRELPWFDVATIGSRFHTVIDGVEVRGIPRAPPSFVLPWHLPGPGGAPFVLSLETVRQLLPAALAIAMLGAIESLLSAVVADAMAGTKHDPDSELLALGVGNVLCPFFGGIAATGAIARTATNIRYGARSPVASVVHSLFILVAVLALAPLLSYLPMASLAALLLLVAWNMSDAKHVAHMLRVAPKSDLAVLLVCYGLTVVFDMVVAVATGMVIAAFLFMRRMAEVSTVQLVSDEHPHLDRPLPREAMIYEVSGPLFFGAAEKAMQAFKRMNASIKVMILYLGGVPAMDVTGLVALESALARLRQQGVFTLVTALKPQPLLVVQKAGIKEQPGVLRICDTLEQAVTAAEEYLRPSRR